MRYTDHPIETRDNVRAKALRKESSNPEKILWQALRQNGLQRGLKFRRQQPIHPYIADFACMKIKLIIELDGRSHDGRLVHDKKRDLYLQRLGYMVLRFTNDEAMNNLEGVVGLILGEAERLFMKKGESQTAERPLP